MTARSRERDEDPTATHRDNVRQNLARVEAMIRLTTDHQRQNRAGLMRERDDVQRAIHHHHGLLADPSHGPWTAEERADYESLLARRHHLDTLLAEEG